MTNLNTLLTSAMIIIIIVVVASEKGIFIADNLKVPKKIPLTLSHQISKDISDIPARRPHFTTSIMT
jgi:hypothetical protein